MRIEAQDVRLPLVRPRVPRRDGRPPKWRLRLLNVGWEPVAAMVSVHAVSACEAIGLLATMTDRDLADDEVRWDRGEGEDYLIEAHDDIRVVEVEEDDEGAEEGGVA